MDLHPNLLNYYYREEDRDFIYLAIEKCEGNLEDLINLISQAKSSPNPEEISKLPLGSVYHKSVSEISQPDFLKQIMLQAL